MVKAVYDTKSFYEAVDQGKFANEDLWNFMATFFSTFSPVFTCTKKLQNADLIFGDFIFAWMELKMELKDLNNSLSNELLNYMESRQEKLLNNDICKASLYFDPRFNFEGSNSQYLTLDGKKEAEVCNFNFKLINTKEHVNYVIIICRII